MKSVSMVLCAGLVGLGLIQPASAAETAKSKEKVLYSFGVNSTDGEVPYAGLIAVKGTLYGTTEFGGTNSGGTVFALNPKSGAETVLYSFCSQQNCPDGGAPIANLVYVKGILYGTTNYGGIYGVGTVFGLDLKTGGETVLHSFGSGTDGTHPYAGLTVVNGILYGTTSFGGNYNVGTVFSVDPKSQAETVLYSFTNGTDSSVPYAGLIEMKGTLYGTTIFGGAYGDGTVFALDLGTGAETVRYSFCSQQNCTDGAVPYAGLIEVKGTLYGTTTGGGTSNGGTVFALDPSTGIETLLYSFCSRTKCADGQDPDASLIDVKGTLYGTTLVGGTSNLGTVFSLDLKTGKETVRHTFGAGADGQEPFAGLIDMKGMLYGTTGEGGAYSHGTAFVVTP